MTRHIVYNVMLILLPHDASEVSSSYHAFAVETILRDNASVNHGWSQVCLEVLNTSFETSCFGNTHERTT